MGNAQSDRDESQANDIIQWIPGLNIVYGGVRSIVYAAKGDSKEAGLSAIRAAGTGMGMVVGAAGGPVASVAGNLIGAGVSEGLSIPIKSKVIYI